MSLKHNLRYYSFVVVISLLEFNIGVMRFVLSSILYKASVENDVVLRLFLIKSNSQQSQELLDKSF